jgi:hypothetical protein
MKKLIRFSRSNIPVIFPVIILILLWVSLFVFYPLVGPIYSMLVLIKGETKAEGTLLNVEHTRWKYCIKTIGGRNCYPIYRYKFNIISPIRAENMEVACKGNNLTFGSKIQLSYPVGFEQYAVPDFCREDRDLNKMYLGMFFLTAITVLWIIFPKNNGFVFQKSYPTSEKEQIELQSGSHEWLTYLLMILTTALLLGGFYLVAMKIFS